jgi:hypothetical protein
MKNILSALIAITAVAGFASAASAAPTVIAQPASGTATSIHTGSVNGSCSVEAFPGTLAATSANTIDSSASPGSFETICNRAASQVVFSMSVGTAPAAIAITPGSGYTESAVVGGATSDGAYASLVAAPLTVTPSAPTAAVVDLTNSTLGVPSATVSKVKVVTTGTVASGILPAGSYVQNVIATVTP